jgi:hypothetical protein
MQLANASNWRADTCATLGDTHKEEEDQRQAGIDKSGYSDKMC